MSDQKISTYITETFGANADYVQGLLARFKTDPSLVDASWQEFFGELLQGGAPEAREYPTGSAVVDTTQAAPTTGISVGQAAVAPAPEVKVAEGTEVKAITGPAKKIVENMEQSLAVPTATSLRSIPVKVLIENRSVINDHLAQRGLGKVSFTHLIAWAIIKAVKTLPQMNHGFAVVNGKPSRLENKNINIGVAIDIEKKDGSRSLLVPNIKNCEQMNFADFFRAYNSQVKKARDGALEIADFQGTTISLTNPGTIGTNSSAPRLMQGQSAIIATGAIEYPAEFQGMTEGALAQMGISRTVTVTSTYDHRVIQGAESGMFLSKVHEFVMGKHGFFDEVFQDLEILYPPLRWAEDFNPSLFGYDQIRQQTVKQAKVLELINAYRTRGHMLADIDPLNMLTHDSSELNLENFGLTIWDLDREFIAGGLRGKEVSTLREILWVLRRAYCGKVGIEYRHIQSLEQKQWLREQIRREFVDTNPLSAETKKELLAKLIEAEQFEQFLHKKYLGQKRFSLEGCETVIPMLDQLVENSSKLGVEEIFMGMAHRGRLNVLSNIVGNAETGDLAERIFTVFEGTSHPSFPADEGDVKYHQGAIGNRSTKAGKNIKITLSSNPSHLEFVNPVVEGMARARQDEICSSGSERSTAFAKILPVLMHGDAAFAGQGVVMETLQLANLVGYRTGGTIHIVINNQIGFTTSPESSRSSIYSTDAAQITQTPIFHINGDDPEAAFRVIQIALGFRQKFNKDVVLDLVGFRRLGHNEGDEPSYTQPVMYSRVKAHPGTRHLYAQSLIREGVITDEDLSAMTAKVVDKYEGILANAKKVASANPAREELAPEAHETDGSSIIDTAITNELLTAVSEKISLVPDGFNINPKMVGQLGRRAKMGSGEIPMDWGFAEAMAFGSIVVEGNSVRLSGQDSGRGTFSQRHACMYDTLTGERWTPLAELKSAKNGAARFDVFDSSLSEVGVLGFEYGYTTVSENDLVMWEAQFGDFSNGAQVIIDQYISSSEDKWKQSSRLVMLLPHGYEGQGPEHSSARLERYLQLCAENNMQVCYPSTPSQYFHLLRRQVRTEQGKPLVVMTPKSLLRLPEASSQIADLTSGGFKPVLNDGSVSDNKKVKRVVLCAGKVFYDLDAKRRESGTDATAIIRLEQFYPFPQSALKSVIDSYSADAEIVWVQEEPKNMGAWGFLSPRIDDLLNGRSVRYIGRAASASPATGSYAIHNLEQAKIIAEAIV